MPPFLKRHLSTSSSEHEEEGKGEEDGIRQTSRTVVDPAVPNANPDVALIPHEWKFAVVIPNRFMSSPPALAAFVSAAAPVSPRASRLAARGKAPAVAPVTAPSFSGASLASARGGVLAAAAATSVETPGPPARGTVSASSPSVSTAVSDTAKAEPAVSLSVPMETNATDESAVLGLDPMEIDDPVPRVEPAGRTKSVPPVAGTSSKGPHAIIKARDSETPSTDVASRGGSAAPGRPFKGYKMTTDEAAKLKQEKPEMFRLLFWRRNIQKYDKKVKEQGADSLTMEDVTMMKQGLGSLAYLKFEDDAMEWIDKTGILLALRLLANRVNFDDDTVGMATTLRQRWMEGNFNPGPISSEEPDFSDSESQSEPEEDERFMSLNGLARALMRGILRYRNARGHMTMKLDPKGYQRRADVFGNNGLTVGEWWPYQLCALRDGAHGSRQGGIAGRADTGAFSIVVSAESEYGNEDSGEQLSYLGTQHCGPEGSMILTNATKALIMSIHTRKPVRVIRRGPSATSRVYPSCGFRYDGLYTATARSLVRARRNSTDEHDFYKFTLVRNPGQPPLSDARRRPTQAEYAAYSRLTNSA